MKFQDALGSEVIICDGAMGTQLQARGIEKGVSPESWNIERPEAIQAIHEAYLAAGAQMILTNTFGANRLKQGEGGKYSVAELNQAAAKIARGASAGAEAWVVGDVGPTGRDAELLLGGADLEDKKKLVYDVLKEQASALEEAGVDAILIETMMSLDEAVLAASAATENTALPVMCTMTFRAPPPGQTSGFRTYCGDKTADVVQRLGEAGVVAVGANCGDVVDDMPSLAAEMRSNTNLPLIFEINAGLPEVDENYNATYGLEPTAFADIVSRVVEEGAGIVGGCCGTSPEHIAAIKERLKGSA